MDGGYTREQNVLHIGKLPKFTKAYDIYEMLEALPLSTKIAHKDVAIQFSEDDINVIKVYIRFPSRGLMMEARDAINRVIFFGTALMAEEKMSTFEPFRFNREFAEKKFRLVAYPVLTCRQRVELKEALQPYGFKSLSEVYDCKEVIFEFDNLESLQAALENVSIPDIELYADMRYNKYVQRVKTGEILILPHFPQKPFHRTE